MNKNIIIRDNMKILQKSNYRALYLAHRIGSEETLNRIIASGLCGRGGANFKTGQKWEIARNTESQKKYVICNADEGEPGTFKDRFIIENNFNNVLEGMAIAAFCIGADEGILYLRGEYAFLSKKILKMIKAFEKKLLKMRFNFSLHLFIGAGSYVCGDETALINSIEGFRGEPYVKPPYPTVQGLHGKPTVINNVETMANVPIALIDLCWNKDLRLFSVSGNVGKPGIYELPLGTPLKELIAIASPKYPIKAVAFGCAGGILPASDFPLNYETVKEKGAFLGSCTIILIDNKQSLFDLAITIAEFFVHESCGKCTPCREGTVHLLDILRKKKKTKKLEPNEKKMLEELTRVIADTSLCGLGMSSTNYLKNIFTYFKEELA